MENNYNPVQLNETIKKSSDGTILETSLMLNIRAQCPEEAIMLYTDIKERLGNGTEQKKLTGMEVPDAPTCERCGEKMVLRQNAKKKTLFFGCSKYPRCKSTKEYIGFEASKIEVPF